MEVDEYVRVGQTALIVVSLQVDHACPSEKTTGKNNSIKYKEPSNPTPFPKYTPPTGPTWGSGSMSIAVPFAPGTENNNYPVASLRVISRFEAVPSPRIYKLFIGSKHSVSPVHPMKAVVLLCCLLSVYSLTVDISTTQNIQSVINGAIRNTTSGDIYFNLDPDQTFQSVSIQIISKPTVNVFFSNGNFITSSFSFQSIGNVTFSAVSFAGSSISSPALSLSDAGSVTVSSCVFTSITNSSLYIYNAASVSIDQCTFQQITISSGLANVHLKGLIPTISITGNTISSCNTATPIFHLGAQTPTAYILNNTFTDVVQDHLEGQIDMHMINNINLVISYNSFSNAWTNYGVIKVAEGRYDKISITDNLFLANLALFQVYFDWYTFTNQVTLSRNTFTQARTFPQPIGIGPQERPIYGGLILISGTHDAIIITESTAKNCLMGQNAAFIALMRSYGVASAKSLTLINVTSIQNQLMPLFINTATAGNVTVLRSKFQFNSAISSNSTTMPSAGCMTIVRSSVGSLVVMDTDISFNNGPIGGMYIEDFIASIQLYNVTAINNQGTGQGGMMYLAASSSGPNLNVSNCVFQSNLAVMYGGALYITSFGPKSGIYNSRFEFNTVTNANGEGGAFYLKNQRSGSSTYVFTIDGCDFQSNSASYGATLSAYSRYKLTGSSFSGHPPSQAVIADINDYVYVSGCQFNDIYVAVDGSPGMIASQPQFNATYYFADNTLSPTFNHQMHNYHGGSVTVNTYTFVRNSMQKILTNTVTFDRLGVNSLVVDDNMVRSIAPSLVDQVVASVRSLSLKGNGLRVLPMSSLPLNLVTLDVSRNLLTDISKTGISSSTTLQTLILSDNLLVNVTSLSMPSTIQTLDVSRNRFAGTLDVFSTMKSLQNLYIDGNSFHGSMTGLMSLNKLNVLSASDNLINGTIPPSFSTSLPQIRSVNLSNNDLSGTLSNISGAVNLVSIDISSNFLGGNFDALNRLTNLNYVNLSHNQMSGSVVAIQGLSSLLMVDLSSNTLYDSLDFSSLSSLVTVAFDDCSLSGSVPQSLFILGQLKSASLSGNSFDSLSIPPKMNLSSLQTLQLARNQLSNSDDFSTYANIPNLNALIIDNNKYQTGLARLNSLSSLQTLSASDNRLTDDVSTVGMQSIEVLKMRNNQMVGQISSLGNLKNLVQLDVSGNRIAGSIADSLNGLTRLIYLNLSHNAVQGPVTFVSSTKGLITCDLSSNNFTCPINWDAYYLCSVSCARDDKTSASVRLRVQGNVASFDQQTFQASISQIANISLHRVTFMKISSGSVITDLNILPPTSEDINQGSSPYVVDYLKTVGPKAYSDYNITLLDSSDVPSDNSTFFTTGIIIAIVAGSVGLLVIITIVIATIVIRKSNKRKQTSNNEMEMSIHYEVIDRNQIRDNSVYHNGSLLELASSGTAEIIQKVGEGAYGVVWKARYRGNFVAMKQIKTADMEVIEGFMSEVELMKRLSPHPNVVSFIGFVARPLALITEFMEGGSLESYVIRNPTMSYKSRVSILKGVADGMAHLASERVLHKDLAARNVLLSEDLVPKVSDFGLSRILASEAEIHQSKSPEALRGQFSEKSDVWAWGVLCIEVMTGNPPFPDLTAAEFVVKVASDNIHSKLIQQIPERTMDSILSHTLVEVFQNDPNYRPTFSSISSWLVKSIHSS
ncbi:hypothetical protein PROFUN_13512 [Planoprotostelium fungivorum]|uniref:Protein kinase domain-containing protein n=1 Tax=Planoprotostelium fungivorum TaxID=1890364 RepID=A0A2P6N3W3_9EUKA|nr:hypothetical protein PROFUN_13512 [Planoprotostelium fungivorum]